jgi:flavodoxin
MKILNLYYSQTGNTEKIARKISSALKKSGHDFAYKKASA